MSRKRPRIDGFIRLLAGGRSSAREAVICGDCGIDLVASEYATLNEVDIAIGFSLSERARQCQHHLCMRCLAMAHADRGAELRADYTLQVRMQIAIVDNPRPLATRSDPR